MTIGDKFVANDLRVLDRENKSAQQLATGRDDDSRRAVDQRQFCESGARSEDDDSLCHRTGAPGLRRPPRWHRSTVGPPHHVRRQHSDDRVDVAGARRREEGLDYLPAPGKLRTADCGRTRTLWRARLASFFAAAVERPTMDAISSNGAANMS